MLKNEDLFHIANSLIKGRISIENTTQVLEILARNCLPPYPENEIKTIIESVLKRVERREKNLSQEVREWVLSTTGQFLSTDIYKCLNLYTRQEKKGVSEILRKLNDDKIIERFGTKNGQFRKINNEIEVINWYDADEKNHLPIEYPLDLHDYVLTLPRNIVIIGGSKDAGKTCFLLNTACLNRNGRMPVKYFSSEMGEIEMKKRLVKLSNRLNISLEEMKTKIDWIERSENFADAIFPEALNVIDFLEVTKDFYEVGDMIKNIYHKLTTGIVIIGIQKPSNRDMPVGGEKGLEKARLAIAMGGGKAKILVGKNWARDYDPRGLECRFQIIDGSGIRMVDPWNRIEIEKQQGKYQ